MKYPHIMRAAAEIPWAMERRKLEQIAAFLELKAAGLDVPEDIRAEVSALQAAARRPRTSNGVAVVPIMGVISYRANLLSEFSGGTSIQQLTRDFREAVNNPDVGTIVLQFDSPGGTVDGIPELAAEILAARDTKKIIAVADTFSASAAYWLMSAATEIVVTPSGRVGSVGTYSLHFDESGAYEKAGIKPTIIASTPEKGEGSELEPLTKEAQDAIRETVRTFDNMFVGDVAKGRGVSTAEVREKFGNGRIMLAKAAKAAGMVDRVDTFSNVLARLGVDVGLAQGRRGQRAEVDAPDLRVGEDGPELFAGVDLSSKDDAVAVAIVKSPEQASDTELVAITLGTDEDGRNYVRDPWPKRALIFTTVIENHGGAMTVEGDLVTISCENGIAQYVKQAEDQSGNWICRLVNSVYEPGWPPELEPEAAEPQHNPRHRRLALLKHA